ncbi:MAG: ribosome hibernation-promoting factor, HPF/YfiA family [Bdellovibrionota bacterium]|jgi:putative sigma-54 modulation protein
MVNDANIISMNVTFRNMDVSDALRNYAEEKLEGCLRKFIRKNTEVNIILLVEKHRQIAEISFASDGVSFKNSEESDDMYKSIDKLVDSLTNQLRRHKEKLIKRN